MFWNLGWLGRQQPWNSAVVLVGRISWKGCFSCWCILALFVFCDTGVLFLIASLVNWCSLEWNSVDSSCSVNKSYNTCPNTILLHIPQICSQSKWVSSNVGPFCLLLWFYCKNITCIALIGVINFLEYLNNLFMENFFVSCLVCIAHCADILIVGVITLWRWLGWNTDSVAEHWRDNSALSACARKLPFFYAF